MVPRHLLRAAAAAALVLLWRDAVMRVVAFTSPGLRLRSPGIAADGLAARGAAPQTGRIGKAPQRRATVAAYYLPGTALQHSPGVMGAVCCAALGLALAGAKLRGERSQGRVALGPHRRASRYTHIYGGDGPPQPPPWINKQGEEVKHGRKVPAWLTLSKWESSFSANDRARSLRWYLQYFDEEGNPAVQKDKEYTISEAVDIIMAMNERAPPKVNPSLEAIMRMNLDSRFPDQQIRTSIKLPHGTGKKVRVAVFCPPEEEEEVMALGVEKCGKILAEEIAEEKIDFDILIAKPQMMPRLAKLGRILGPRRLMPSPKSGTVVQDYAEAIKDFSSGGTVELRGDSRSLVQCPAGKLSLGKAKLVENFQAVLKELADKRPPGAKKEFWKAVYMGSSLSPSIKISPSQFPAIIMKADEE